MAPAHKQTPLKEQHGTIMAEQRLPDRADGQRAGATAELPSVPALWGQRLQDSDVTIKAFFLSRHLPINAYTLRSTSHYSTTLTVTFYAVLLSAFLLNLEKWPCASLGTQLTQKEIRKT